MDSEYHHGDMDIHEQTATFKFFIGMTKWGSLGITALLVLLTVWFCTPAGFLPGLVAAIVVTAIGVVLLREKPGAGH